MLECTRSTSRSSTSALPDGSGLELLRRVRARGGPAIAASTRRCRWSSSPAAPSETDRVRGFERGCRRLRHEAVLLRRAAAPDRGAAAPRPRAPRHGRLRVGELSLDPVAREVRLRGAARRPVREGVRAAPPARRRAYAGLHEGRAAPRRLGLPRRWARRGPWTATRAGCGTSSAARGDRFVVNVWGVGYRLVDGPAARGGGMTPRRSAPRAVAVAALARWRSPVRAPRRGRRARRPGQPRAARAAAAALLGLPRPGDAAAPPRRRHRPRAAPRGARARRPRRRRARRRAPDRAEAVEVGALLAEAVDAWRPLAAARHRADRRRPPGARAGPRRPRCGSPRRSATSPPTRSSTAEARSASACVQRRPAARGSSSPTRAPGPPAPVGELIAAARGRRARRGHGLALAAGIAERHGGRLLTAPVAAPAPGSSLELPCDAEPVSRDRPRRLR